MREQFEKLPQIAKMIESGDAWWSEKYNSYSGSDSELDCYVSGAWYAYQEQEERFNKRRPELDSDTCSDIRNHVSPLTKVIDR